MAGTESSEWTARAYRILFAFGAGSFAASILLGFIASFQVWGGLPELFPAPNVYADKLYEEGDLVGAEREYRMADVLSHSVSDNSVRRVEIYQRTGDRQGYLDFHLTQAKNRPFELRTLYALGIVQSNVGKFEDARRTLERLMRLSPNMPGLHAKLGIAQFQTGEVAAAEATFRAGLAGDPLSAELHEGLGRSLAHRGATEDARFELQRAIELDPGRRSARELLQQLVEQGGAGT